MTGYEKKKARDKKIGYIVLFMYMVMLFFALYALDETLAPEKIFGEITQKAMEYSTIESIEEVIVLEKFHNEVLIGSDHYSIKYEDSQGMVHVLKVRENTYQLLTVGQSYDISINASGDVISWD